MAIFLSRDQIYRMLQRELPEKVYPDGAPSAFFSTADNSSIAGVISDSYSNLKNIYDNYWPQHAVERLPDWETMIFGFNLDASLSLTERRNRVLAKFRTRRGITKPDMEAVVRGVLGDSVLFDIIEWGCSTGGWILDESQLDIETYLNGSNLVDATGPDLCGKVPSDFGLTQEEWEIAQEEAYTYEVLVYGHVLTAAEYAEIDRQLNIEEPARSRHIITDNLDPNDLLGSGSSYVTEDGDTLTTEDGDILVLEG